MSDIPQDSQLLPLCNETELMAMAKRQGLPRLRRGIQHPELVAIVTGELEVRQDHLSQTSTTRGILEDFITQNWGQLRSQLPGCNGKCRTYQCTEGKHALCFFPNKGLLR